MIKRDELECPTSCLNKAGMDDYLFVLIEKDLAMADTIEYWIKKRVELGLNWEADDKMRSAQLAADEIRRRQRSKK